MEVMDSFDKDALREVLVKWYGPQAHAWQMNDDVLIVVLKMLDEMHHCTAVMHFVPMPPNFGSRLSQMARGYVKQVLGALKESSDVYLSCAKVTILAYKTEVILASM
jgi:hypothetical protein